MVRDLVQRGWRHPAGHSGGPLPSLGVQGDGNPPPGQKFLSIKNTSGYKYSNTLGPYSSLTSYVALWATGGTCASLDR